MDGVTVGLFDLSYFLFTRSKKIRFNLRFRFLSGLLFDSRYRPKQTEMIMKHIRTYICNTRT